VILMSFLSLFCRRNHLVPTTQPPHSFSAIAWSSRRLPVRFSSPGYSQPDFSGRMEELCNFVFVVCYSTKLNNRVFVGCEKGVAQ